MDISYTFNMNIHIERDLKPELLSMAQSYPVVTIIGPRQSGKTTLVKETFKHKPYISLENLDEKNFADSDPKSFLERFPDGAILDEIQRTPQLLSYIQGIVDEKNEKGQFILTGSHQLSLHEAIAQSLAGRTAILKLLPFSLHELVQSKIDLTLDEYMLRGMYPRIYQDNLNPTKHYSSYVQTYLERDVRKIINVKDLSLFQKFIKICAGRVGKEFNSESISNEVGISHHTVREWFSVLEASFLVFKLQPYYENFGKRIIKSPKIYFTDVGLVAYLLDITTVEQITRDPLRGFLFENLVVLDFIKERLNHGFEPNFYYYRDSNKREVDLLFKNGNHIIPLEIKSSKTFVSEFCNNVEFFKNLVPDRAPFGYVVYAGEQQQWVNDIQIVNFKTAKNVLEYIKKNT
jgi:predicted AAA+ superfamily ATPase